MRTLLGIMLLSLAPYAANAPCSPRFKCILAGVPHKLQDVQGRTLVSRSTCTTKSRAGSVHLALASPIQTGKLTLQLCLYVLHQNLLYAFGACKRAQHI